MNGTVYFETPDEKEVTSIKFTTRNELCTLIDDYLDMGYSLFKIEENR